MAFKEIDLMRQATIRKLNHLIKDYQLDHELDHKEMDFYRDNGRTDLALENQLWCARAYRHIQILKAKLEALQ